MSGLVGQGVESSLDDDEEEERFSSWLAAVVLEFPTPPMGVESGSKRRLRYRVFPEVKEEEVA